ncbi:peptide chain release factor 1, mitochondrial isoform X2 [Salarias fasciatus]|uniref:Prokaryotic-type class I peptide chain release factors domain-containing protein n=1 Tax=Salarias fasciatus TaxID=181472 RepID=A0A672HXD5_SALFA|nr:peptide chain release factor 1, mitochondrial isoform X2 [Salarias fasciatus]
MLAGGLFRLCSSCRGVVSGVARGSGRWRTVQGRSRHTGWLELYERESVQRYLRRLLEEHEELSRRLQRAGPEEAERRLLAERRRRLLPVAAAARRLEAAGREREELAALLDDPSGCTDADLTRLLKEEEQHLSRRTAVLREELIQTLVPGDPLDGSAVVLEVVSGRTTGGDVCQQFTREMLDMYRGYADYRNWDFQVLNYSPAEHGGLHHAAVRVAGDDAYRLLKHEGGTHRVQRIPEAGLSSRMQRIHTGTATVVVLPEAGQLDVQMDHRQLRVDTFRSRGPGGQSVNTTDSAVRVVHLPTGISAECQQSRSQLKNRDGAMRALRARLQQSIMGKETESRLAARRQQVGSRAQAERIRTYNFSQDRVTDHRTGYNTRDIKEVMRGGEPLHHLIQDVLQHSERRALLEAAESPRQPAH